MSRAAALACLAALIGLAPLQAEAARLRMRSFAKPSAPTRAMIVPIVSGSSQGRAVTTTYGQSSSQPEKSSLAPAEELLPLRLGVAEPKSRWCRSEVVVGGFCMVN